MEEFASEFKKIRGKLSFLEMSEKTGLSHAYLVHLEQQNRQPSPSVLRKISNAFNVSYIHLMIKAGYLTADDLSEIKNNDN